MNAVDQHRLVTYRERLLDASPDALRRAPHYPKKAAAAALYALGHEWPRVAYWRRPERSAPRADQV